MPHVDEIISFLDENLKPDEFQDLGPNGLQIPGNREIKKVATGVSANLEFIERAVDSGADLLLVHHGLLWDFQPTRIDRLQARRLRAVLANDVHLAMYHLPLDAHPQFGNNALIAEQLGLEAPKPFGKFNQVTIGVQGTYTQPISAEDLSARVGQITQRKPLTLDFGPAEIKTVGIISGGAAGEIEQAIEQKLDAFITGEPKEHVFGLAKEAGIHFIAAGHHATETFGVRKLGELLSERFEVTTEFIDVPNPI